jgi:glycosyltransferase involved in cell wall biosynthesis
MRVLIAHPGMQHAHQLAWALEEAGHLTSFWSGVPVVDSRCPKAGLCGFFSRHLRAIPVSAGKRGHAVIFPLLRRLVSSLLFGGVGNALNHRLDRAYDIWVARRIRKLRPDMVVCYENSALHTFRAAHAVGAVCVLDAASVHYLSARQWLSEAGQINPAWVDAGKQQEIELADAILTCSEFAAESYFAAGIPANKVFPVPLGAVVSKIQLREKGIDGPCRFVFVGTLRCLKGVDILLDVFEELGREGLTAELELIGGTAELDLADRAEKMPNVSLRPFMPQVRLFSEVAQHDCLILPSRFDSFGMVVAEAMAVGVPAIVSDRVGAKCIIEQHPEAGWIVPCDKDSLKEMILQVANNRTALTSASQAALLAVRDYSWESYRHRVVATLEGVYAQHK